MNADRIKKAAEVVSLASAKSKTNFFGKNYIFRDAKKTIRSLQKELTLPVLWKPPLSGGLIRHITGLGMGGDCRGEESRSSSQRGERHGHQCK